MKITEITSALRTYRATVRIVVDHVSVTAHTTIDAGSHGQARMMLARMYGIKNVMHVTEIMHESPMSRPLSSAAIAEPIKRELIRNRLTKLFMQHSNLIKPTSDDVAIAKDRAETKLKRADLAYKKAVQRQQWLQGDKPKALPSTTHS